MGTSHHTAFRVRTGRRRPSSGMTGCTIFSAPRATARPAIRTPCRSSIPSSCSGPGIPFAANPVMLDRAGARPGGNFVTIDRRLWRPVQDCTYGYGCALGLAEVTELSPTSFSQVVRHVIWPGPLWPGRKLHTLNRCGRLELIDGTSIQPRLAPRGAANRAAAPQPVSQPGRLAPSADHRPAAAQSGGFLEARQAPASECQVRLMGRRAERSAGS